MKKLFGLVLLVALLSVMFHVPAYAGKIVVANDEWTLSDSGFGTPNDPGKFATNVASWFTGGKAGNFLAYSSNFGLNGFPLASAMTGAGNTWTVSTSVTFDLPTLKANYNGVFLAGDAADNNVLINYVNAGGNVYVAGGTGWGGADGEAANWNTFLNYFGLGFVGTSYNGVGGDIAINSTHPIFNGVDHLYQDNGNSVVRLSLTDPNTAIPVTQGGEGLYGVYAAPVPLPAAVWLFGPGLLGLAAIRRRFTK
jgi:hypothetical protein